MRCNPAPPTIKIVPQILITGDDVPPGKLLDRAASSGLSHGPTQLGATDQFGKSPKSFETHGHSMIVDPWGKILAELADGAGVISAEIDLDYLTKVRAELPSLSHRRL